MGFHYLMDSNKITELKHLYSLFSLKSDTFFKLTITLKNYVFEKISSITK